MFRNIIIYFLFIILGVMVQSNIATEIFMLRFAPDFLLIISIAGALKFKSIDAIIIAFVCGLISDFATGLVVGPQAAGNLLACVVTQSFSKNVYANRFLSIALISAGAAVTKDIITNLIINVFSPNDLIFNRFSHILKTMPSEVFITALLAPFLIKMISKKIVAST